MRDRRGRHRRLQCRRASDTARLAGCSGLGSGSALRGWRVHLPRSRTHVPGQPFQDDDRSGQIQCRALRGARAGRPAVCYQVGGIEVAETQERWEDLKRKHGLATSWGLESELISPQECVELVPVLDANRIRGGFYVPTDGIAKAVRACEAMARLAGERGAKFYGETEVTGIEVKDGRVRSLETDRGRVETELVVSCAGMWGPRIGRMVGMKVPLVPMQHQYAWTTPLEELAGETREVVHP